MAVLMKRFLVRTHVKHDRSYFKRIGFWTAGGWITFARMEYIRRNQEILLDPNFTPTLVNDRGQAVDIDNNLIVQP